MPFLSPNQQCQSTEGKISHFIELLTPSSPGVFQLCLWPLIAPGYLGEGCHASHQPSDASTSTGLPWLIIIITQTLCIPQGSEIRGFRWSIYICSTAFENLGVPSASTCQLLSYIGQKLTDISGESCETSYLFQSWYSALTLFCCMTVCQIVTARITRHTQLFVDFPNF